MYNIIILFFFEKKESRIFENCMTNFNGEHVLLQTGSKIYNMETIFRQNAKTSNGEIYTASKMSRFYAEENIRVYTVYLYFIHIQHIWLYFQSKLYKKFLLRLVFLSSSRTKSITFPKSYEFELKIT